MPDLALQLLLLLFLAGLLAGFIDSIAGGGGMITLPVNPAGDTVSEQFLFVAQYALAIQRTMGCKILVSTSVTPPLDKTSFGDVYFDHIPLSARGLVRLNDYAEFAGEAGNEPGALPGFRKRYL